MGIFRFKALTKSGEISEGTSEGDSRLEVIQSLTSKGFQVLSVEEESGTVKSKSSRKKEKAPALSSGETRLTSGHLIQFTEELSDLLCAGIQLDRALRSIAERSKVPSIRDAAASSLERVKDGEPLSSALRHTSSSFSELYCSLVGAGEVSGSLGDILKRLVHHLSTLAELRSRVATAMIYPIFLIIAGVGVAAMFAFFLIPRIRRLVESTGGDLPFLARFMLGSGDFLRENWVFLLGGLAVIIITLFSIFQSAGARYWWARNQLRIPALGRLMLSRFNLQFAETLSNLLINGVPLVKALELVANTTGNPFIRDRISSIREEVSDGASLSRTMERAEVFEAGLIDMTRIGEETGDLATSLNRAGERLDREFTRSIERIETLIQPTIIVIMALVVGSMAYIMISIIYETISILRSR